MNDYAATNKNKFKKFKRVTIKREYAVQFRDSNTMIDFICSIPPHNIQTSMLYTKNGTYQLIVTTTKEYAKNLYQSKPYCTVFEDKLHIDEIKLKNRLICKDNAISKLQKAFKAP